MKEEENAMIADCVVWGQQTENTTQQIHRKQLVHSVFWLCSDEKVQHDECEDGDADHIDIENELLVQTLHLNIYGMRRETEAEHTGQQWWYPE